MKYKHEEMLLKDIANTKDIQIELKNEFYEFIKNNQNMYYERNNKEGHITCSMFVVNAEMTKTLLTSHKKLNKWLQLGGHNDSEDKSVLETSVKEMFEEGFDDKEVDYNLLSDYPIDMDIHGVGDHKHYDICYSCSIKDESLVTCSEESHELAWVTFEEILKNDKYESRLKRMVNVVENIKNSTTLKL